MDNSIYGAEYPVVFGSPIHSPYYTGSESSEISVKRMNELNNASESLVSGYYLVATNPNPNRANQLFHCSAFIPHHSNVIHIQSFDVVAHVANQQSISTRRSMWPSNPRFSTRSSTSSTSSTKCRAPSRVRFLANSPKSSCKSFFKRAISTRPHRRLGCTCTSTDSKSAPLKCSFRSDPLHNTRSPTRFSTISSSPRESNRSSIWLGT